MLSSPTRYVCKQRYGIPACSGIGHGNVSSLNFEFGVLDIPLFSDVACCVNGGEFYSLPALVLYKSP